MAKENHIYTSIICNPRVLLQVIAGLVRKQVEPEPRKYGDVTTEEVNRVIQALAASHGQP